MSSNGLDLEALREGDNQLYGASGKARKKRQSKEKDGIYGRRRRTSILANPLL